MGLKSHFQSFSEYNRCANEALHAARCAEDQRIIQYFQQIDASYLTKELTYVNTSGQEYTSPFHILAAHVFNHQTHHRGQVHHMLGMAGIHPPSLDMPRVLNT